MGNAMQEVTDGQEHETQGEWGELADADGMADEGDEGEMDTGEDAHDEEADEDAAAAAAVDDDADLLGGDESTMAALRFMQGDLDYKESAEDLPDDDAGAMDDAGEPDAKRPRH